MKSLHYIILATSIVSSSALMADYDNYQPSCRGPGCQNSGQGSSSSSGGQGYGNYYDDRADNGYSRNNRNYDSNDRFNANGYERNNDNYNRNSTDNGYYDRKDNLDRDGYQRNNMKQNEYRDNNRSYNKDRYDNSEDKNYNNPKDNKGSRSDRDSFKSDKDISDEVRDTLKPGWLSKGYENVTYKVNNGVIHLAGTVNNIEDKQKVEKSLAKIEGVREIRNHIAVADAKEVSDKEIDDNIRDNLKSGWFSKGYDNVSYKVNRGVVDLTGSVASEDDKEKLEKNLSKVDGIRKINNNIIVSEKDDSRSSNKY